MDLRILFIDNDFVVCEKPSGISSESPGLPDLLKEKYRILCYPVHRLDLLTGGVCVLAFSKKVCHIIQCFFREGKVRKEYLAVLPQMPDSYSGVYKDFLYHDKHSNKTYVVKKKRKDVKEAVCSWQIIETVNSGSQVLCLIRVLIETGRTHQIRVQFASRGLPLVGDRRYGSRIRSESLGLWSSSISFPHPVTQDQTVEVRSVPPPVFPWNLFHSVQS